MVLALVGRVFIIHKHVKRLLAILTGGLRAGFLQIIRSAAAIGPAVSAEMKHQTSMGSHSMALVGAKAMEKVVLEINRIITLRLGMKNYVRGSSFGS